MNKKFTIQLCGDLDFEGMVVDVCFNNWIIASINYDKGVDNLEVSTLLGGEAQLAFPLKDLLDALEKAKKLAIQCAEEDKLRDQK